MLLISKSDNKVRLEIGRGMEGCLNDSKCGRILDDYFVPYRENDEYTKATDLTVKAVLNVIADEYNVTIQGLEKSSAPSQNSESSSPISTSAIIILIIVFIALIAIAVWSDDDSGSGYYGGSSFGGGGSFGGGFSGGGGASR